MSQTRIDIRKWRCDDSSLTEFLNDMLNISRGENLIKVADKRTYPSCLHTVLKNDETAYWSKRKMKNILYFFLKVTKSFSLITNLNLSDKIQSVAMFAEAGSSVAKHRSFTVICFLVWNKYTKTGRLYFVRAYDFLQLGKNSRCLISLLSASSSPLWMNDKVSVSLLNA